MPQLLLAMMRAVGCWICCTVSSRSEAPTPQFAPIATGCTGEVGEHAGEVGRGEAHHRAAGGVERAGDRVRQAGVDRRPGSRPHLLGRRLGLDPGDVGAAGDETLDLLAERCVRVVLGDRAERLQQLAGRADRAGDEHRPVGCLGDGTGQLGGLLGDLGGAVAVAVQVQAVAVAPEGVGEDDVGAGVDEGLVQRGDLVRLLDVPELGRLARPEAHPEEVGAGGTVGEQGAVEGEEGVERCPHGDDQASGRSRSPPPICQPGRSPLGNGVQAIGDLADEPAGGPVVGGAGDVAGSGRRAGHVDRVGATAVDAGRDEAGAPASANRSVETSTFVVPGRGTSRRSGRRDAAVERRALDVIDRGRRRRWVASSTTRRRRC